MYFFVKAYKYKLTLILNSRKLLHDFVTKLKKENFFRITPTKLIADEKINSNELDVIAAIYLPQKAQVNSVHRYVLYLLIFSLAELILSSYDLLFIAAILVVTYIHMTFYDRNAVHLILESFRKTAQAIYNYHAYDLELTKKPITAIQTEALVSINTRWLPISAYNINIEEIIHQFTLFQQAYSSLGVNS